MRRLIFLLALMVLGKPALPQAPPTTDLQTLLAKPTMKLKDLTPDTWRQMRVKAVQPKSSSSPGLLGVITQVFGSLDGSATTYFTQGQTLTLNGKTYFVVYVPESAKMDMAALTKTFNEGGDNPSKPPTAIMDALMPKRTPDTVLSPAVLSLDSIQSIDDVRPFDLNLALSERSTSGMGSLATLAAVLFPVFSQAREKAQGTSSLSNLKQIGLGVMMYTQDYDEYLPPMQSAATVKKAIDPYVKNDNVFLDPRTKEPYKANASLSYYSMAAIDKPAEVAVFYEGTPAPDNTRGVVFADGHAKRVPESEWPAILKASTLKPYVRPQPAQKPKRPVRRGPTRKPQNRH